MNRKEEYWKQHPSVSKFEVSNFGNVRNSKTKRIYAKWKNKWGYELVSLSTNSKNKHYQVHRLVLETFVGFSNLNVNHKDFNRSNNNLSNLEYLSQSDNIKYSYSGKSKFPPQKGKINYKIACEIRNKIKCGCKQKDLALEYKVSTQLINSIHKNRCWVKDINKEASIYGS